MSSGEFYRSRIITDFNIPQIQSGRILGFIQVLSAGAPIQVFSAPTHQPVATQVVLEATSSIDLLAHTIQPPVKA